MRAALVATAPACGHAALAGATGANQRRFATSAAEAGEDLAKRDAGAAHANPERRVQQDGTPVFPYLFTSKGSVAHTPSPPLLNAVDTPDGSSAATTAMQHSELPGAQAAAGAASGPRSDSLAHSRQPDDEAASCSTVATAARPAFPYVFQWQHAEAQHRSDAPPSTVKPEAMPRRAPVAAFTHFPHLFPDQRSVAQQSTERRQSQVQGEAAAVEHTYEQGRGEAFHSAALQGAASPAVPFSSDAAPQAETVVALEAADVELSQPAGAWGAGPSSGTLASEPAAAPFVHGVASEEQEVQDPWEWRPEDGQGAVAPADAAEGGIEEPHPLRGGGLIRTMQSWHDMQNWLDSKVRAGGLRSTELSRMWTHLVEVRRPHVSTALSVPVPACHTLHPAPCEHQLTCPSGDTPSIRCASETPAVYDMQRDLPRHHLLCRLSGSRP